MKFQETNSYPTRYEHPAQPSIQFCDVCLNMHTTKKNILNVSHCRTSPPPTSPFISPEVRTI